MLYLHTCTTIILSAIIIQPDTHLGASTVRCSHNSATSSHKIREGMRCVMLLRCACCCKAVRCRCREMPRMIVKGTFLFCIRISFVACQCCCCASPPHPANHTPSHFFCLHRWRLQRPTQRFCYNSLITWMVLIFRKERKYQERGYRD